MTTDIQAYLLGSPVRDYLLGSSCWLRRMPFRGTHRHPSNSSTHLLHIRYIQRMLYSDRKRHMLEENLGNLVDSFWIPFFFAYDISISDKCWFVNSISAIVTVSLLTVSVYRWCADVPIHWVTLNGFDRLASAGCTLCVIDNWIAFSTSKESQAVDNFDIVHFLFLISFFWLYLILACRNAICLCTIPTKFPGFFYICS